MKKLLSVILVVLLGTILVIGCGEKASESIEANIPVEEVADEEQGEEVILNVFAAASMTEALNEIAELYKEENHNVIIDFNFDSSGTLQTQIESGAEADIFLSAAMKQMTELAEGGYINEATQKDLLLNKVVLIAPGSSEKDITSYEDVATDKVSLIALGNADVPCGQYAEEIFTSLGIWDEVLAKTSFGENVKAILSQVESSSVDAGVVYATDVASSAGEVKIIAESPQGSHSPVIYPAAVLSGTAEETTATEFLDYLSSPKAVVVFEKIGFTMAN